MKQKLSILVFAVLALLFVAEDIRLFQTIQSVRFHQNRSTPSISVKSVMLDHVNSYVMSPLSRALEEWTQLTTRLPWLSANQVSYFGVFIALIASKVVINESLFIRRVAILIFLARQFVDDLDGLVARVRMGVDKSVEVSVVGSQGYVVDGLCDAIGFTCFLVAVFVFALRKRKLDNKYALVGHEEADPLSARLLLRNHVLFGLLLLLSCVLWNRYIDCFHRLLETSISQIKVEIFKSRLQWLIMWAWRCFGNAHQLMNFFLVALWLNKSQQFVQSVHVLGFVALIGLSFLTEVHLNDIETYLNHISLKST